MVPAVLNIIFTNRLFSLKTFQYISVINVSTNIKGKYLTSEMFNNLGSWSDKTVWQKIGSSLAFSLFSLGGRQKFAFINLICTLAYVSLLESNKISC